MADSAKHEARTSLRNLRALLRSTTDLDPDLRRRWLEMLPHLSEDERERLGEILSGEAVRGARRD